MTAIEELIQSADRLCASFDRAISTERRFCESLALDLERMNWESLRMANDLKRIKEYGDINT